MTTTDDKLLKMVRDAGHRYGPAILATSKRRLSFALALAVVEQESTFRNIFGCDKDSIFCNDQVTPARVQQLIAHVEAGGISNGVGLTQLTSIGFIRQAEALGGAHRVRPQCRVAFGLLHDLIEQHGEPGALAIYNGGPVKPNFAYTDQVVPRRDRWQALINRTLS